MQTDPINNNKVMETLFFTLISAVLAVVIGESLRDINYRKQQRDDLFRRIIHYSYQLTSQYSGDRKEIIGSLNEIKFWYFDDKEIKDLTFKIIDLMKEGENTDNLLISLIEKVSTKEDRPLSKEEIDKVFTTK